MDNITTIEVETTALTVIPAATLPTILAADDKDILGKLAAKLKTHKPDVSTTKGRAEIRSLANEIATSKMDLIRLGKGLTESWRNSTKAVNEECKVIEDRMDALKEQVRAPLTEFENREKTRVAAHEAALAAITEGSGYGETETIAELEQRLDHLSNYPPRDWQEFSARARDTLAGEMDRVAGLLAAAQKREVEAAELERLRTEEADEQRKATHHAALKVINDFALVPHDRELTADELRARLDRLDNLPVRDWEEFATDAAGMLDVIRRSVQSWLSDAEAREAEAQRLREEQIAAEAAAKAKAEAEARAAQEAAEAERRAGETLRAAEAERVRQAEEAARQQREAAEALERAEAERLAGIERERLAAEKAEAERIARHRSALGEFSLIARSLVGQPSSEAISQSIASLQRLHANRDWEEFTERATKERADTMATFQSAYQTAKAREKQAAEAEAERSRQQTIEAERQRVAREEAAHQAEESRRAANKAHRAKVNNEVLADLIAAINDNQGGELSESVTEDVAKAVIVAVAKETVRHMKVIY